MAIPCMVIRVTQLKNDFFTRTHIGCRWTVADHVGKNRPILIMRPSYKDLFSQTRLLRITYKNEPNFACEPLKWSACKNTSSSPQFYFFLSLSFPPHHFKKFSPPILSRPFSLLVLFFLSSLSSLLSSHMSGSWW